MPPSSKYTDEFKMKVAKATLEEGSTLKSVGAKFGVNPTLVRNWRIKFGTQPDVTQDNVLIDASEIETALEDLGYEIEEYLQYDGSEYSIEGFSSIIITCSNENNKLSVRLSLLTDHGEKENIDGNWKWVFSGEFDEDHTLSGIMECFGDKFSEILNSFNLEISNVAFTVEPYPEEGN